MTNPTMKGIAFKIMNYGIFCIVTDRVFYKGVFFIKTKKN